MSALPSPIPQDPLARLGRGLGLPFRAAGFLVATPALWPLALIPIVLTLLGIGVSIWLGWGASGAILRWLGHDAPEGWAAGLFWQAVRVALYLALVLMGALLPPLVVSAPINDRLSQGVEARILGTQPTEGGIGQFARELLTSIANGLARLLRFGVVQALLFLLSFVPVLQAAYPVLAFLWSALWLAEQSIDQTAARHLYTWRDTRNAVREVRPLGFGMGLVLAALFLLPLANLLVVPIATVSGALFYCDLVRAERWPARANAGQPTP